MTQTKTAQKTRAVTYTKKPLSKRMRRAFLRDWQLLLLCLLPALYFLIFHYIPMYGVQLAFKDFQAADGIWGSQWAGFKYFERFFTSYQFWPLIKNTLLLSFGQLLFGFPIPIILAILLNQTRSTRFRKFVQTITYCPHFISIVVLVGMLNLFLSPRSGLINHFLGLFGVDPIHFMGDPGWFRPVFILSGIWQNAGWSAIIYIAALSNVDPEQHEAAVIDGASRFQRILHIDFPAISTIVSVMLIMSIGGLMGVGYEKVLLMQTDGNLAKSEIIATYVYKKGLTGVPDQGYATAIGLFNSVINVVLLVIANTTSKKFSENSLW